MMRLISVSQTAENGQCGFRSGFVDHDGLKTTFQSGVFFDILAILVQCCGTDHLNLTPPQSGFQNIGGIDGSFRRTGSHNGVQFIQK